MLDELATTPLRHRRLWAGLIRAIVNVYHAPSFGKVLLACSKFPELATIFAPFIQPVQLDSDDARQQRDEYERNKAFWERQNSLDEKQEEEPNLEEVLTWPDTQLPEKWTLLAQLLSGDLDNFPEPNIEAFAAWIAADQMTQAQIQEVALSYLKRYVLPIKSWRPFQGEVSLNFYCGHLALRLLMVTAPERLKELSLSEWAIWAPASLLTPCQSDDADSEALKNAYQKAPEVVIEALCSSLEGRQRLPQHLDVCWDAKIEKVLYEEAFQPSVSLPVFENVLEFLLEQKSQKALDGACAEFTLQPRSSEYAITAAYLAFVWMPQSVWPRLFPILKERVDFGRQVMEKIAGRILRSDSQSINQLPIQARAQLYSWLEQHFPSKEDPPPPNGKVRPRQNITEFRSTVLVSIRDSGEEEAVPIIEQLIKEFPEDEWLPWNLVGARDAVVRKTASVPTLDELKRLLEDPHARLPHTGEELLDIIIESLKKLEDELQGETPLARLLWDDRVSFYRPKDEAALSDYIKRHLQKDLRGRVVAKREVEVRKTDPKSPRGDSNDLQVVVPVGEDEEELTVIIEVKGDWNEDVMTSMQSQLRDQYLIPNRHRYGLYVVGWYQSDDRKPKISKRDINEARTFFIDQASQLTDKDAVLQSFVLDVRMNSGTAPSRRARKKKLAKSS